MERKKTLNEAQGKALSDLEAVLIMMNKLLDDRIEQKPKAGITLAKEQPNERKLRYTEARTILRKLENFFEAKGCLSFGVCETCLRFDQAAHGNKAFGTCKRDGSYRHIWDSCSEHSKKGGGHGI